MQYQIREKDGTRHGPYSLEELATLRDDGVLTASSMVAASGTDDFRLARLVPGLFWKDVAAKDITEVQAAFTAQDHHDAKTTVMPLEADRAAEPAPNSAETDWSAVEFEQPTNSGGVELASKSSVDSRRNGQSVVNWMWGLSFAAWGACFIPIPGVSTFLVWIFASLASLVAFVAMFKNRVGSGVAGLLALIFVTPLIWFLTLSLYANLLINKTSDDERQRASRAASSSVLSEAQSDGLLPDKATDAEMAKKNEQAKMPPLSVTIRDACLAWKCGSDGGVLGGQQLIAFRDYKNPDSRVIVPGGTTFYYIDTVSITTKPVVTEVVTPFFDPVTRYKFEKGDLVYIYANWGEGCVASWVNGHKFGFSSSETSDGGHDKTKIDCVSFTDSSTGNYLLKYPYLDEGNTEVWTFAEFVIDGGRSHLYFQDQEAIFYE